MQLGMPISTIPIIPTSLYNLSLAYNNMILVIVIKYNYNYFGKYNYYMINI